MLLTTPWALLALAIACEVVATSALREAEGFTRWLPTALAVSGYGVSFYCLSLALRTVPLGIAYAIWSGVGLLLICLVGLWRYGQRLDLPAVLGIGLIVAGVAVISLFSRVRGG